MEPAVSPCSWPVWLQVQSRPCLYAVSWSGPRCSLDTTSMHSASLTPGAVLTPPEAQQVQAGMTAMRDGGGAALRLPVSPEGLWVWVEDGAQAVAVQHSDNVLWQ